MHAEACGADPLADAGAASDLPDDPPGTVPVQAVPVMGEEDGPGTAFADCQVDLAASAGNGQGPVPAFGAQVLDVGAGGFVDPQPVQDGQGDQRVLERRAEPGH